MARIKITDLPKDLKISAEEMKRVRGGGIIGYTPSSLTSSSLGSPFSLSASLLGTHKDLELETELKVETDLNVLKV